MVVYWVVGLLWTKMFENYGHRVHVTNGWYVTSSDRRERGRIGGQGLSGLSDYLYCKV